MAESVAGNDLAALLHLLDDVGDAGTLGYEDVDAVKLVHDLVEALGFGLEIDAGLGNVNGVDVLTAEREIESGEELRAAQHLTVVLSRLVGKPTAVAAHNLVNRESARIGAVLLNDIHEELRALFGGRPGAEGLLNRIYVIVDRLGKTDDDKRIVVGREISREIGSRRVGIVTADGVEDVNAVLDELIGRDLERIFAFLYETALDAVLDVRKFNAAVADRGAAVTGEDESVLADLFGDRNRLALEKTHITVDVTDHFDVGVLLVVFVDKKTDRRAEARSETARGEERNLLYFFSHFISLFLLLFQIVINSQALIFLRTLTISIAACITEKPLLPCFVPQRSTACSRFSAETTPSRTGTPVLSEILLNASAVAVLIS